MKEKKQVNLILYLLLLFLLIGSVAFLVLSSFFGKSKNSYQVYVYQNGTLYGTYPLNTPITLILPSLGGGYNTIEIRDGTVAVIDSDCPNKVCVNQGAISNSLLPITCIPHHLVIELRPSGEVSYDTITY